MSKKPRLVFTDIQRRTLHAIFKETKRPSKEMQATIAHQLGLEVATVANFFMNARRRSLDKWKDECGGKRSSNTSGTHAIDSIDSANSPDSSTVGSECPDSSVKNSVENNSFFFPTNPLFDGMNNSLSDNIMHPDHGSDFTSRNPYSMTNPRIQNYQKNYSNSPQQPSIFNFPTKKNAVFDRSTAHYRGNISNSSFPQNSYYNSSYSSNIDYMNSRSSDDILCSEYYMNRSRDIVSNFLSLETSTEKPSLASSNRYDESFKGAIDFSNSDGNLLNHLRSLSSSPNSNHSEIEEKRDHQSIMLKQSGMISAAAAVINAN